MLRYGCLFTHVVQPTQYILMWLRAWMLIILCGVWTGLLPAEEYLPELCLTMAQLLLQQPRCLNICSLILFRNHICWVTTPTGISTSYCGHRRGSSSQLKAHNLCVKWGCGGTTDTLTLNTWILSDVTAWPFQCWLWWSRFLWVARQPESPIQTFGKLTCSYDCIVIHTHVNVLLYIIDLLSLYLQLNSQLFNGERCCVCKLICAI